MYGANLELHSRIGRGQKTDFPDIVVGLVMRENSNYFYYYFAVGLIYSYTMLYSITFKYCNLISNYLRHMIFLNFN